MKRAFAGTFSLAFQRKSRRHTKLAMLQEIATMPVENSSPSREDSGIGHRGLVLVLLIGLCGYWLVYFIWLRGDDTNSPDHRVTGSNAETEEPWEVSHVPILPSLKDRLAARASPLDGLDPRMIPFEQRLAGQPAELVAVIGQTQPHEQSLSFAFAPDGHTLAVGWNDKTVQLFDLTCERPQLKLVLPSLAHSARELAWAPDCQRLALSFENNTIALWHVGDGIPRQLAELSGPEEEVNLPKFVNKAIAARIKNRHRLDHVVIHGLDHPEALRLEVEKPAPKVAFTFDGKVLLASSGSAICSWNLEGKATTQRIRYKRSFRHGSKWALSPFEPIVAVTEVNESRLFLWNLSNNELNDQPTPVTDSKLVAFAGDPDQLVSLRHDPNVGNSTHDPNVRNTTVLFWDWRHHAVKRRVHLEGPVAAPTKPAFARNTQAFALLAQAQSMSTNESSDIPFRGAVSSTILVWSATTGAQTHVFHLPTYCRDLAFAPDGRHLATNNTDGTVYILRLWDHGESERSLVRYDDILRQRPNDRGALAARGQLYLRQDQRGAASFGGFGGELRGFQLNKSEETSLALSADGRRALTAAPDRHLCLWDMETGRVLRKFGQAHLDWKHKQMLALSPNGRRALMADANCRLRLWDVHIGKEIRRLRGHAAGVTALTFSRNSSLALSGDKTGKVYVWDITTGKCLTIFRGHQGPVGCVALSPDGRRAGSGGPHGILRLWDPATGKELDALKGHKGRITCLTFAADGRRVLTGGEDQTLRLWDAGTGLPLARLAARTREPGGQIEAVALSADGRLALSAQSSQQAGILCLWNTLTAKPLCGYKVPGRSIGSIALAADGRHAWAVSADGTVCQWQMPLNAAQALADLSAVVRLDPTSAPARVQRARYLLRQGRIHEALANIAEALRLDDACEEAYFWRAMIHSLRRKYDLAIADLSRVVGLNPCHARAWYERGLLRSEKRDYAGAKTDLENALQLDPKLGNGAVP
jgi:WD40 repeat protein